MLTALGVASSPAGGQPLPGGHTPSEPLPVAPLNDPGGDAGPIGTELTDSGATDAESVDVESIDTVPPDAVSDHEVVAEGDLSELARLSEEAGALGEELHRARELGDAAAADADRLALAAGVAAGRAAVADRSARSDQALVDRIAMMRFRGGDTRSVRAVALAQSPEDLVSRLDVLNRLSEESARVLERSRATSVGANQLRESAVAAAGAARLAADDARARLDEVGRRSEEMRLRVEVVRGRVDALTGDQRLRWAGGAVVPEGYVPPPVDGVNTAALRTALTRVGAPYSWGATGPSEFDCSGLMVWAYAREGKSLPRSSQSQAVSGKPVAMADIEPGDLVIYYPGATHVGMYAGDGLVLHAPTYGVPVKLEKVDAMPISGVRRY